MFSFLTLIMLMKHCIILNEMLHNCIVFNLWSVVHILVLNLHIATIYV